MLWMEKFALVSSPATVTVLLPILDKLGASFWMAFYYTKNACVSTLPVELWEQDFKLIVHKVEISRKLNLNSLRGIFEGLDVVFGLLNFHWISDQVSYPHFHPSTRKKSREVFFMFSLLTSPEISDHIMSR